MSFLGERQAETEPSDINREAEDPGGGEDLSRRRSSSLPPTSRPSTPPKIDWTHDAAYDTSIPSPSRPRRLSMLQTDNTTSPATPSPTAIPLVFRRPPSAGFTRSSSATPIPSPALTTPRTRKPRPLSTEFKTNEIRPLWLIERHQSKPELDPAESLPSLPSSHSGSRASSVHGGDSYSEETDLRGSKFKGEPLDIEATRDYMHDILDSQETTPTAATYQVKHELGSKEDHREREQDFIAQATQEALAQELEWNQKHAKEPQQRPESRHSSLWKDAGSATLAGGAATIALASHKDKPDTAAKQEHDADLVGSTRGVEPTAELHSRNFDMTWMNREPRHKTMLPVSKDDHVTPAEPATYDSQHVETSAILDDAQDSSYPETSQGGGIVGVAQRFAAVDESNAYASPKSKKKAKGGQKGRSEPIDLATVEIGPTPTPNSNETDIVPLEEGIPREEQTKDIIESLDTLDDTQQAKHPDVFRTDSLHVEKAKTIEDDDPFQTRVNSKKGKKAKKSKRKEQTQLLGNSDDESVPLPRATLEAYGPLPAETGNRGLTATQEVSKDYVIPATVLGAAAGAAALALRESPNLGPETVALPAGDDLDLEEPVYASESFTTESATSEAQLDPHTATQPEVHPDYHPEAQLETPSEPNLETESTEQQDPIIQQPVLEPDTTEGAGLDFNETLAERELLENTTSSQNHEHSGEGETERVALQTPHTEPMKPVLTAATEAEEEIFPVIVPKKGKKGKKGETKQSEPTELSKETEAITKTDLGEPLPLQFDNNTRETPVTVGNAEENEWASFAKKKSNKGKQNQTEPSESLVLTDAIAKTDLEEPTRQQAENGAGEALTTADIAENDDSVSSSKKRGKKAKKNQSEPSQLQAKTNKIITTNVETLPLPQAEKSTTRIPVGTGIAEEDEWASSGRKNGKEGKKQNKAEQFEEIPLERQREAPSEPSTVREEPELQATEPNTGQACGSPLAPFSEGGSAPVTMENAIEGSSARVSVESGQSDTQLGPESLQEDELASFVTKKDKKKGKKAKSTAIAAAAAVAVTATLVADSFQGPDSEAEPFSRAASEETQEVVADEPLSKPIKDGLAEKQWATSTKKAKKDSRGERAQAEEFPEELPRQNANVLSTTAPQPEEAVAAPSKEFNGPSSKKYKKRKSVTFAEDDAPMEPKAENFDADTAVPVIHRGSRLLAEPDSSTFNSIAQEPSVADQNEHLPTDAEELLTEPSTGLDGIAKLEPTVSRELSAEQATSIDEGHLPGTVEFLSQEVSAGEHTTFLAENLVEEAPTKRMNVESVIGSEPSNAPLEPTEDVSKESTGQNIDISTPVPIANQGAESIVGEVNEHKRAHLDPLTVSEEPVQLVREFETSSAERFDDPSKQTARPEDEVRDAVIKEPTTTDPESNFASAKSKKVKKMRKRKESFGWEDAQEQPLENESSTNAMAQEQEPPETSIEKPLESASAGLDQPISQSESKWLENLAEENPIPVEKKDKKIAGKARKASLFEDPVAKRPYANIKTMTEHEPLQGPNEMRDEEIKVPSPAIEDINARERSLEGVPYEQMSTEILTPSLTDALTDSFDATGFVQSDSKKKKRGRKGRVVDSGEIHEIFNEVYTGGIEETNEDVPNPLNETGLLRAKEAVRGLSKIPNEPSLLEAGETFKDLSEDNDGPSQVKTVENFNDIFETRDEPSQLEAEAQSVDMETPTEKPQAPQEEPENVWSAGKQGKKDKKKKRKSSAWEPEIETPMGASEDVDSAFSASATAAGFVLGTEGALKGIPAHPQPEDDGFASSKKGKKGKKSKKAAQWFGTEEETNQPPQAASNDVFEPVVEPVREVGMETLQSKKTFLEEPKKGKKSRKKSKVLDCDADSEAKAQDPYNDRYEDGTTPELTSAVINIPSLPPIDLDGEPPAAAEIEGKQEVVPMGKNKKGKKSKMSKTFDWADAPEAETPEPETINNERDVTYHLVSESVSNPEVAVADPDREGLEGAFAHQPEEFPLFNDIENGEEERQESEALDWTIGPKIEGQEPDVIEYDQGPSVDPEVQGSQSVEPTITDAEQEEFERAMAEMNEPSASLTSAHGSALPLESIKSMPLDRKGTEEDTQESNQVQDDVSFRNMMEASHDDGPLLLASEPEIWKLKLLSEENRKVYEEDAGYGASASTEPRDASMLGETGFISATEELNRSRETETIIPPDSTAIVEPSKDDWEGFTSSKKDKNPKRKSKKSDQTPTFDDEPIVEAFDPTTPTNALMAHKSKEPEPESNWPRLKSGIAPWLSTEEKAANEGAVTHQDTNTEEMATRTETKIKKVKKGNKNKTLDWTEEPDMKNHESTPSSAAAVAFAGLAAAEQTHGDYSLDHTDEDQTIKTQDVAAESKENSSSGNRAFTEAMDIVETEPGAEAERQMSVVEDTEPLGVSSKKGKKGKKSKKAQAFSWDEPEAPTEELANPFDQTVPYVEEQPTTTAPSEEADAPREENPTVDSFTSSKNAKKNNKKKKSSFLPRDEPEEQQLELQGQDAIDQVRDTLEVYHKKLEPIQEKFVHDADQQPTKAAPTQEAIVPKEEEPTLDSSTASKKGKKNKKKKSSFAAWEEQEGAPPEPPGEVATEQEQETFEGYPNELKLVEKVIASHVDLSGATAESNEDGYRGFDSDPSADPAPNRGEIAKEPILGPQQSEEAFNPVPAKKGKEVKKSEKAPEWESQQQDPSDERTEDVVIEPVERQDAEFLYEQRPLTAPTQPQIDEFQQTPAIEEEGLAQAEDARNREVLETITNQPEEEPWAFSAKKSKKVKKGKKEKMTEEEPTDPSRRTLAYEEPVLSPTTEEALRDVSQVPLIVDDQPQPTESPIPLPQEEKVEADDDWAAIGTVGKKKGKKGKRQQDMIPDEVEVAPDRSNSFQHRDKNPPDQVPIGVNDQSQPAENSVSLSQAEAAEVDDNCADFGTPKKKKGRKGKKQQTIAADDAGAVPVKADTSQRLNEESSNQALMKADDQPGPIGEDAPFPQEEKVEENDSWRGFGNTKKKKGKKARRTDSETMDSSGAKVNIAESILPPADQPIEDVPNNPVDASLDLGGMEEASTFPQDEKIESDDWTSFGAIKKKGKKNKRQQNILTVEPEIIPRKSESTEIIDEGSSKTIYQEPGRVDNPILDDTYADNQSLRDVMGQSEPDFGLVASAAIVAAPGLLRHEDSLVPPRISDFEAEPNAESEWDMSTTKRGKKNKKKRKENAFPEIEGNDPTDVPIVEPPAEDSRDTQDWQVDHQKTNIEPPPEGVEQRETVEEPLIPAENVAESEYDAAATATKKGKKGNKNKKDRTPAEVDRTIAVDTTISLLSARNSQAAQKQQVAIEQASNEPYPEDVQDRKLVEDRSKELATSVGPEGDWAASVSKRDKKGKKSKKQVFTDNGFAGLDQTSEEQKIDQVAKSAADQGYSRSSSVKGAAMAAGAVGAGIALFEGIHRAASISEEQRPEGKGRRGSRTDHAPVPVFDEEPQPTVHKEEQAAYQPVTQETEPSYRDSALHMDSPMVPEPSHRYDSVRDSGFQDEHEPETMDRPLQVDVEADPAYTVSISSPGRGQLTRGDLEPLLPFPADLGQASPRRSHFYQEPSPVDSTTKGRSTELFGSSPSTRDSLRFNEGHLSIDEITSPNPGPPRSLFGGPSGVSSDCDVDAFQSPPRTPIDNATANRPLATIEERSPEDFPHINKPRHVSEVGSPEHSLRGARRSITPHSIPHHRVRSPLSDNPRRLGLISTDELISSLAWPEVDEEKHAVDLERSLSRNTDKDRKSSGRQTRPPSLVIDPKKVRSASGGSVRSNDSINAIIRSPPLSTTSTPPLRRVDRSLSSDLRAAKRRDEPRNDPILSTTDKTEPEKRAKSVGELHSPKLEGIASSSTYDPTKDKGKGRIVKMTDVYVSVFLALDHAQSSSMIICL